MEWCTRKYNMNYGNRTHKNHKGKKVHQCKLDGTLVKEWNSLIEAQKTGLYTESGIRHCITGRQKQYKGYIWSYIKQIEVV